MVYLMYHDIVTNDDMSSGFQNDSAFQYKVEAKRFEEQVKALAGNEKVVFTFDDGGESFIELAAPILEKYGKRGMFFVSTKYIGSQGFLSRQQVKELEKRGHIVGSHSHTHPHNMATLSTREIEMEWKESLNVLNVILGHEVHCCSIPNGYGSSAIFRSAGNLGVTEVYTSKPTTRLRKKGGVISFGRYVVNRDTSVEDVISLATSTLRQWLIYGRWQVLEMVKKMLGNRYDRVKARFVNNNDQ